MSGLKDVSLKYVSLKYVCLKYVVVPQVHLVTVQGRPTGALRSENGF